ncbi:uncharacterized protein PV07_09194 [Cladophialophora immunda]|uniref:Uncharacterized protein n=1 Tax=Cladophialophora immunda TaxID=569365 RepID=A0A0D1ZEE1_9EURO|nr:uncharacterized protein PV07_09194 [Cladophialophora immunda]KIW26066.1 hypothetical protein PV07_09194 [Cladophialophora immunda]
MLGSKTLILTSTYPADLSPPPTSRRYRLRRRFITALHLVSLLASLIALSLFSAAIPRWNANFFHNTGPNRGDWTDGMPLGPLVFAFLYHAIVLLQGRMQKNSRSTGDSSHRPSISRPSLIIHTCAPMLVLLSLLPALFLAGYGSLFRLWQPAVHTQSGILVCNMLNIFARECEPTLYDIGSLQLAGITFGTVVWILHFALLLVSLRDIRRCMLVKQLQREKIAQYARSERSYSRGSRQGYASRHGPTTRSHGSGDHSSAWPQHVHSDRYRGGGSRASLNSKPALGSGSRSNSLNRKPSDSQHRTSATKAREHQQEVPICLVQAPDETHPPVSLRYT